MSNSQDSASSIPNECGIENKDHNCDDDKIFKQIKPSIIKCDINFHQDSPVEINDENQQSDIQSDTEVDAEIKNVDEHVEFEDCQEEERIVYEDSEPEPDRVMARNLNTHLQSVNKSPDMQVPDEFEFQMQDRDYYLSQKQTNGLIISELRDLVKSLEEFQLYEHMKRTELSNRIREIENYLGFKNLKKQRQSQTFQFQNRLYHKIQIQNQARTFRLIYDRLQFIEQQQEKYQQIRMSQRTRQSMMKSTIRQNKISPSTNRNGKPRMSTLSSNFATTDFFTARNSMQKSMVSFQEVIQKSPNIKFDELPSCPVINQSRYYIDGNGKRRRRRLKIFEQVNKQYQSHCVDESKWISDIKINKTVDHHQKQIQLNEEDRDSLFKEKSINMQDEIQEIHDQQQGPWSNNITPPHVYDFKKKQKKSNHKNFSDFEEEKLQKFEKDQEELQMQYEQDFHEKEEEVKQEFKDNSPRKDNNVFLNYQFNQEVTRAVQSPQQQAKIIQRLMNEEYGEQDKVQHQATHGEEYDFKYLISSQWWKNWMEYVNFGKKSQDSQMISNYPSPGQIKNEDLLKNNEGELKDNISEHHDYECLSEKMWITFKKWYNYDHIIKRKLIKDQTMRNQLVLQLWDPAWKHTTNEKEDIENLSAESQTAQVEIGKEAESQDNSSRSEEEKEVEVDIDGRGQDEFNNDQPNDIVVEHVEEQNEDMVEEQQNDINMHEQVQEDHEDHSENDNIHVFN